MEFKLIYTQREIDQRDLNLVKDNCKDHFLGMLSDTFEKIENNQLNRGTIIKVVIEVKSNKEHDRE